MFPWNLVATANAPVAPNMSAAVTVTRRRRAIRWDFGRRAWRSGLREGAVTQKFMVHDLRVSAGLADDRVEVSVQINGFGGAGALVVRTIGQVLLGRIAARQALARR